MSENINDYSQGAIAETSEDRPDKAAPFAAAIGQRFWQSGRAIGEEPGEAKRQDDSNQRPAKGFRLSSNREIARIKREEELDRHDRGAEAKE